MSDCQSRDKAALKLLFIEGATPSQEDFCSLIESTVNMLEENQVFGGTLTIDGTLKMTNLEDGESDDHVIVLGDDQTIKKLPYPVKGDITKVSAGAGLGGGGLAGDVSLYVYPGNGIDTSGDKVNVRASNGIISDTDGVKVKAASGIEVDGSGVKAKAGDGIVVDNNGIKVNATSGLHVDYKGVKVNPGNGIDTFDGKVNVNVGAGLSISGSSQVQLDSTITIKNGHVGIGETSPTKELHVKGGVRVAELAKGSKNMVVADANGVLGLESLPSQGDITGVAAGAGLTGGGSNGNVSLSVSTGAGIAITEGKVSVVPGKGIGVKNGTVNVIPGNGIQITNLNEVALSEPLDIGDLDVSNDITATGVVRAGAFELLDGSPLTGGSGGGGHWVKAGTDLEYNDGNVGIGGLSSGHKLMVESNNFNGALVQTGLIGGIAISGYNYATKGNNRGVLGQTISAGSFSVAGIADQGVGGYFTSKTGHGLIVENGNVGIGVLDPQSLLHVNGSIQSLDSQVKGADYAEFFKSKSGKSIPAGTSVILEEGLIRPAKARETPIGIISVNPGILGGVYSEWPKKYMRDEFGNKIMEKVKVPVLTNKIEKVTMERQKMIINKVNETVSRTDVVLKGKKYVEKQVKETVSREVEELAFKEVPLYDKSGKKVIGVHNLPVMEKYTEEKEVLNEGGEPVLVESGKFKTVERPKLNPDYDPEQEYIARESRPEWNSVGLLGQIPMKKGQAVAPTWLKIKDISDKVEMWLVK